MTVSSGPTRLSQRLGEIASAAAERALSLGDLLAILGERGHAVLAFVLVIPFLQPIPLPGVSTVFGLAIAIIGLQIARNGRLWLPHRLATRALDSKKFSHVCDAGRRLFLRFENVIRPRWRFMHARSGQKRLAGAVLCLAGLLLALPLPVPASNFVPALGIALLALGLLEEDGVLIALGYVAVAVACAFIATLVVLPFVGVGYVL